jgi:hypothetical protein
MVDPMKLAERKRELTHEEYLAMSRLTGCSIRRAEMLSGTNRAF